MPENPPPSWRFGRSVPSAEALLDALPVAAYATDPAGRVTYVNRRWLEYTGLSPEESLGLSGTDPIHPNDLPAVLEAWGRALASLTPYRLEYRLRRADGEHRWHIGRAEPVFGADGACQGWVGTATDVHDLHAPTLEPPLEPAAAPNDKDLAERYRALADSGAVGVLVANPDGRITDANDAFLTMLGLSRDDLGRGLTWQALTPTEWAARDEAAARDMHEYGTVAPYEKEFVRADGSRVPVLIGASVIGPPPGAGVAFVLDITERVLAEERLRESETRFRLMVDAVPQMTWITDAQGRVEYLSRQWLEYAGAAGGETAAEVAASSLHSDDAPAVMAAFGEAMRQGRGFAVEQRNRAASGEYRWFLNRGEPYRDPRTGEIVRWFGVGVDIHERKRAELALERSEARYRALVRSSAQLVWTTDADGFNTGPQESWLEFTGQTWAQEQGWGWLEAVHPDDRERIQASWRDRIAAQQVYQVEQRLRRFDGEYRHMEVRAVPVRDEDGTILEWVGTHTDITDRKRAEAQTARLAAELDAERRLLETFIGAAPVGFAFLDPNLRYVRVNEALAEINGIRAKDHVGRSIRDVVPDLADTAEAAFRAVLERDEPIVNLLITGETASQPGVERAWLESAYPVRGTGGAVLGIGVIVAEITEREQARRSLAESEARLRSALEEAESQRRQLVTLLEHLPVGVIVADASGRALLTNPALEDLWRGRRDLPDRASYRAYRAWGADGQEVGPEDWPLSEALRTGLVQTPRELRFERFDGTHGVMETAAAPILNADGAAILAIAVARDVTERRAVEDRLLEISEAQKRFVSDAAHELRAPLTSIQGNLQLLRRYPDMNPEQREEALRDTAREATRLGRLVSDMLALARGDANATLELAPVRLEDALEQALHTAQPLAAHHTLEVGVIEAAVVDGNLDRLSQLALILLENALKYTPPGGTVRLEARNEDGVAEFRVSDTGSGIAPEDLERVFERFYRADRSRSRGEDPGGTGLGLPIARQIVAQHGGTIHLESELGAGTTAVVRLPLAAEGG
jgi:PAS domain S-box-containing protein